MSHKLTPFVMYDEPRESEFGLIVAGGFDGSFVELEGSGGCRFISCAFNPLSAEQLRQIADHLEAL